jgi:hypothetical protein
MKDAKHRLNDSHVKPLDLKQSGIVRKAKVASLLFHTLAPYF